MSFQKERGVLTLQRLLKKLGKDAAGSRAEERKSQSQACEGQEPTTWTPLCSLLAAVPVEAGVARTSENWILITRRCRAVRSPAPCSQLRASDTIAECVDFVEKGESGSPISAAARPVSRSVHLDHSSRLAASYLCSAL